jgi:CDP-6-deoxy-D-xylo-4-hexulose-3-dehydrase
MFNNISADDRKVLSNFVKKNNVFTQSKKVEEFENKWSKWLGVKYSVFVNSGSSANFLTFAALQILLKKKYEVIVPPLTWVSDIVAVIKNNFIPKFVDINLNTLGLDENEILKNLKKKTKIVFLTHAQGFNALSKKLLNVLKKKKIILIEDVCESHGATYRKKKLGSFGLISNFSFYYAHHLTTIEGGMICTNDRKIYEIIRMLRGHGLLREMGNTKKQNKIAKEYPDLSEKFIFMYPGFNMRNNELSAIIGINQLKNLDKYNKIRSENLGFFLKKLNSKIYFKDFHIKGNSNYAFPLILKNKNFKFRDKLEKLLNKNKIEFRRGNAGGGNQMRQPYLKPYISKFDKKKFKNVEHVHFFGYYIGNYPSLNKGKIINLCKILNSIKI